MKIFHLGNYTRFIRHQVIRKLHAECRKHDEPLVLKTESLSNFQLRIFLLFPTVKNEDCGSFIRAHKIMSYSSSYHILHFPAVLHSGDFKKF